MAMKTFLFLQLCCLTAVLSAPALSDEFENQLLENILTNIENSNDLDITENQQDEMIQAIENDEESSENHEDEDEADGLDITENQEDEINQSIENDGEENDEETAENDDENTAENKGEVKALENDEIQDDGNNKKRTVVNWWDSHFRYACPQGRAISMLGSWHDNGREDRRWRVYCSRSLLSRGGSYWTYWLNDFDHALNFVCPFNSVLSGIGGVHHNGHEDRRYQARCTQMPKHRPVHCVWTGYVNWFDATFHYYAPNRYFIKGWHSYHHNGHEDRRFKFFICRFQ